MLLPAGVSLASAAWLSEVTGLWWNETPERLIMTVNFLKFVEKKLVKWRDEIVQTMLFLFKLSSFFALGSPLINLTFLPPYRRMFGKGGKTNAMGWMVIIYILFRYRFPMENNVRVWIECSPHQAFAIFSMFLLFEILQRINNCIGKSLRLADNASLHSTPYLHIRSFDSNTKRFK